MIVFLLVLLMARIAAQPSFSLLYAGLDTTSAGGVMQALDQSGVVYEVRGDAIYVETAQRDSVRMALASDGLPATGGRGYELLDTLNGFGTTSQMFDAAYWRAKEGELARTIVASPHIRHARVHIATVGSNPFRAASNASASVTVIPAGTTISAAQAKALRFLVASAVPNLKVEEVAVIDATGGVIDAPDDATETGQPDDKANELRARVERLLEARVGPGNAIVEVSVETVTETESIRERRFDPSGRVAISTDTEERANSSAGQRGAVTVASNLPDGDAAENPGAETQASETRERVNYEVSETEREILRQPGAIKRLSVAVLVDGHQPDGPEGPTVPRGDDELAALRDLVASAVGFSEARGDVITLKSMELPSAPALGTAAGPSLIDRLSLDATVLAKMGILAAVVLALALFVVRPVLSRPPAPALPTSLLPQVPAPTDEPAALTGEIDDGAGSEIKDNTPQAALPPGDAMARLRTLIGERQDETIEILRGWLEADRERTG